MAKSFTINLVADVHANACSSGKDFVGCGELTLLPALPSPRLCSSSRKSEQRPDGMEGGEGAGQRCTALKHTAPVIWVPWTDPTAG